MEKVSFEQRKNVHYPSFKYGYAPSKKYPEYRYSDISNEGNEVYDMIRNCLYNFGLDSENYGKKEWNPFKYLIKKGDTVLIKPNWVEEKNENRKGGIDCLVTHASVIRCVIDYVNIALDGSGKIVVGDSPMPDCNLKELFINAHYNELFQSCRDRNIEIEVVDLRGNIVSGFENQVSKDEIQADEIEVNLKGDSYFSEISNKIGRYRNGIVDFDDMNSKYHNEIDNICSISKQVLEADCIINLCKPKTHRKAGYTGALKNFIGTSFHKNSIPHTVVGSLDNGGDEFNGPKFIFATETKLRDRELMYLKNGNNQMGRVTKVMRIPFFIFRRLTHKKYQGTGNWYKNDTIWRSILDIDRAVIYADKDGNLYNEPQRNIFTIGDMIISGEKNGPLAPSSKYIGGILCSDNLIAFDYFLVYFMGLNVKMIPVLNYINTLEKYKIPFMGESAKDVRVHSNDETYHLKKIKDISFDRNNYFTPAEGWSKISYLSEENL